MPCSPRRVKNKQTVVIDPLVVVLHSGKCWGVPRDAAGSMDARLEKKKNHLDKEREHEYPYKAKDVEGNNEKKKRVARIVPS